VGLKDSVYDLDSRTSFSDLFVSSEQERPAQMFFIRFRCPCPTWIKSQTQWGNPFGFLRPPLSFFLPDGDVATFGWPSSSSSSRRPPQLLKLERERAACDRARRHLQDACPCSTACPVPLLHRCSRCPCSMVTTPATPPVVHVWAEAAAASSTLPSHLVPLLHRCLRFPTLGPDHNALLFFLSLTTLVPPPPLPAAWLRPTRPTPYNRMAAGSGDRESSCDGGGK
jgi:hypothetical protein